jgi:hypothetical protein
MTHDELLGNINSPQFQNSRTLETPYIALREVVGLHRPQTNLLGKVCCYPCKTNYPCKTIKAIEKELR